MKIGFLQLDVAFENKGKNIKRVRELLAPVEFDLMVLPEFYATGSLFYHKKHALSLAEPIPAGKTSQAILDIAMEKKAWLIAGILEKVGDATYNSAIIAGPNGYIGKQRKVNLPPEERSRFAAGDMYETFEINGVTVGVLICVDNEKEDAAEILAIKGAKLICQPANHMGEDLPETFRLVSEKNRVYTVSANRVGFDHDTANNSQFIGMSQIIDPKGKIIHRAPKRLENLFVMDIDIGNYQK